VEFADSLGIQFFIALDSAENVHISCHTSIDGIDFLNYATKDNLKWISEIVTGFNNIGVTNSIAVDSSDDVYIS
jgi:hypothetical protein